MYGIQGKNGIKETTKVVQHSDNKLKNNKMSTRQLQEFGTRDQQ